MWSRFFLSFHRPLFPLREFSLSILRKIITSGRWGEETAGECAGGATRAALEASAGWNSNSTPLESGWNPTGIGLESDWNPTGTGVELRTACESTRATLPLVTPYPRAPLSRSLSAGWNRIGIRLESDWNPTGIRLESDWNPTGIRLGPPALGRVGSR
jgi:hypothetical protein